ncbi:DUF305 domain-containing protein [Streptomyces sp. 3MP-14]|uniref:DUF305 domain-containing protein n=1 Tax=Streptomyces mimosae TaxID=2586635 RepID=A0A5N6AL85_9ACTN|nr:MULTISPECIES: DUF305 domain-containing protein [Streptomyces]KAB8168650.1 DUF305 domain-containing protein [Streptomyces mimosae]KAB8178070.1 DUF305 domain-containing protein [Streptomyces sp. 3MP-14]
MTGTARSAMGRTPFAAPGASLGTALGLALGVALLATGCGGSSGSDEPNASSTEGTSANETSGEEPGAASPPPSPSASPSDNAGAGGLSATDLAWAQLMIPVNEQLLPFLDTVAERAEDPALRAFAADLVPGRQAELEALHALLAEAGVEYVNIHEGHNMPGMVTGEELAELAALDGPAFDEEALAHLDEHLTETAEVSRAETEAGTDPATVALAADLDRARSTQSAELDRLTG